MDLSVVSGDWSGFGFSYPGRLPVVKIDGGYVQINATSIEQDFPGTELTFFGTTDDLCIEYSGTVASANGFQEIIVHAAGVVPRTPEAGPCPTSYTDRGAIETPTSAETGPYKFADVYPGVGTCLTEGDAVFPGNVNNQPAWFVEECGTNELQLRIVASGLIEGDEFEAGLDEGFAYSVCGEAWEMAGEAGFTEGGFFFPDERLWAHGMRHYLCFAR
jgi:hypothetical protein